MSHSWPRASWETLETTGAAGLIAFVAGLPLGLLLVGAAPGGIWENRFIDKTVGTVVNTFRAVPFIILMVALIPVTRLIAGTSIGTEAAIVPLATPPLPITLVSRMFRCEKWIVA